jgi:hypothetical protein
LAEGKSEIEAKRVAHEEVKAKWNGWASGLLQRRCAMERSGLFTLKAVEYDDDMLFQNYEGGNAETSEWIASASLDFRQVYFRQSENTQAAVPQDGFALQSGHVIMGDASMNFSGFIFPWAIDFAFCISDVALDFSSAEFRGPTTFYDMRVKSRVYFQKTIFFSNTAFNGCIIEKRAAFQDVCFFAPVRFDRAYFERSARFSNAIFKGYAWFNQVTFNNYVVFRGAHFYQAARFDAMHALRNFVLDKTQFHVSPPTFVQANFIEAPSFDTVKLPRPGFFRGGDTSKVAAYRALRRVAIQGHDQEAEARAFKAEIRSKRFFTDKPWHPAFWFGLIYDATSDFGRSTLRPFLAWCVSILAFALYFLGQSPEMADVRTKRDHMGMLGQIAAYATTAWDAYTGSLPTPCFSKTLPTGDPDKDSQNGFTGLAEPVRTQTNLVNEALASPTTTPLSCSTALGTARIGRLVVSSGSSGTAGIRSLMCLGAWRLRRAFRSSYRRSSSFSSAWP